MPPIDLPRGNAAPRPAPRAAPPANTHTAANPRGVAIAPPARSTVNDRAAATVPARAIQTFHTSEAQSHAPAVQAHNAALAKQAQAAIDRHQLALQLIEHAHSIAAADPRNLSPALYHQYQAAHPAHSGFGLGTILNPLASLTAPALGAVGDIAGGTAHVARNLGSDLVGLGPGLLQGGEGLATALAHDIGHPSSWGYNFSGMPHAQSATAQLLQAAAKSDPIYQGITQGPAAGLRAAEQHPLQVLLDAGGITGVVGKTAGAVARSGALGERAAASANLARAPRILAPGIHEPQAYSRNMLTQAAQRGIEARPALQQRLHAVTGRSSERMLRQRAIEHNQVVNAVRQEVGAAAAKAARKQGMPETKVTAEVRKAQAAATNMLHNEFIQRHSLGTSSTVRGARTLRTLRNNRGLLPMETKVVGAITKRGLPSAWPSRVVTESAKNVDIAAEYHLLPKSMVDTLNRYHPRQVSMVGDTPIFHTPALTIPKRLPGAGRRIGTPQFTRWFRNSVLPFSTKWVLGNVSEAGLRTALAGAHGGDYRLANQVLKEMANQGKFREASTLRAHTLGGAHGAFQERLYQAAPGDAGPWSRLGKAGHLYNRNVERIFAGNRRLEQQFSQAVLGRHMRAKLGELGNVSRQDRVAALAREYAKPEVAAQAGRYGRKTLGKYDAFAPGVQSFIRHAAPFGPWYANAAKFIYRDLPFGHPALTGGVNALHNAAFQQWIKAHSSNNPDQANKVLGTPFGSLLYALKTGKASYQDLGRYTPFGATTGGPIGSLMSPIAPQYQTPLANIFGKDAFLADLFAPGAAHRLTPTGRLSKATKHQVQAGTWGALETALSNVLGQELGPTNAMHRVFVDQGATPYNTEKLWDLNPKMKPGTQRGPGNPLSGANRVFNPFFPIITQPKKSKSKTTRPASGGGGFGGSGGFSGGNFGGGGF